MNKSLLQKYLTCPEKILDAFEKILLESKKPLRMRSLIKKTLHIKTAELPTKHDRLLLCLFNSTYHMLSYDKRFESRKIKRRGVIKENSFTYYYLRSKS